VSVNFIKTISKNNIYFRKYNIIKLMLNIFYIDWDDTLFPTNVYNKINMYNEIKKDTFKYNLIILDEKINTFLNNLNKYGKVFIVTNANLLWIIKSLNDLPKTKKFIKSNDIQIISARDKYKNNNSFFKWKILAFRDILNNIDLNSNNKEIINIISFGDAKYEYNGLLYLDVYLKNKNLNNMYLLKSINFISKPSFEQILNQIDTLNKNISEIINSKKYIDLNFTSLN
jgi:hypothetical protein